MKRLMIVLAVILTFAIPYESFGASCAAGTMTKLNPNPYNSPRLDIIQIALVSDASGDVNGGFCKFRLNGGYIDKVSVKPDSGGTAPATVYNCRINDPLGNDLMQGQLRSLPISNAADGTEGIYTPLVGGAAASSAAPGFASVVCDTMGASKGTTFNVNIIKDLQ